MQPIHDDKNIQLYFVKCERTLDNFHCGKVMFSQASVILSTGGWGCLTLPGQTPPGRTPPRQTPHYGQIPPPRQTPPPGQTPPGRHPPGRHFPWAGTPPMQTPPLPPTGSYCSGRCACCWNVFLLNWFFI